MLTGVLPPASFCPTAPPTLRWLPGAVSIVLAVVSTALTLIGHDLAHPGNAYCPVTEIWRGIMLCVASLGTAAPGVVCGLVGSLCGRSNRGLSLAGLGSNLGFLALFALLWL
jgi:hypothetical protein